MALRRPPTRVELKADDIEEYNEVRLLCCMPTFALLGCLSTLQQLMAHPCPSFCTHPYVGFFSNLDYQRE